MRVVCLGSQLALTGIWIHVEWRQTLPDDLIPMEGTVLGTSYLGAAKNKQLGKKTTCHKINFAGISSLRGELAGVGIKER